MCLIKVDLQLYATGDEPKQQRRSTHEYESKERAREQEGRQQSGELERRCYEFLFGLLAGLDASLDRRLVETFLALVLAIVMHRNRPQGLLLSELGGYLQGAWQAPAGTKRISNLLRSRNWDADFLETYLWLQGQERVEALSAEGKRGLVIWDESVLEKPESLALEGLCAVRSSKAVRLKRIKPGYFNPPGGRHQSVCPAITGCKCW